MIKIRSLPVFIFAVLLFYSCKTEKCDKIIGVKLY